MNTAGVKPEKYLYEFGEFRVDPLRRRLLRHGETVPLTPKAFSILLVLLEKRGAVVGKDELIQKVWPDTFVTEANLTQNISSLRKALGERAHDSRFVVTIPGQGYSFVAEVAEVPREATGEIQIAALVSPSPAPSAAAEPAAAAPTGPVRRPARRWRGLAAGLAGALLAAVAIPATLYLRGAPEAGGPAPAPGRRAIAVLQPRNLSGHEEKAWLSTALAEMLTTELTAGSKLRVIPGERVAEIQKSLAMEAPDAPQTEEMQRIHAILNADLLVAGSFLTLGEGEAAKIRLDVRVLALPDGDVVASLATVGSERELFDLVSRSGIELRRSLGWSGGAREAAQAIQAMRPVSTEAARLHAKGLERLRAFDSRGARDLLQKAAGADPGSARIRADLADAWAQLGYDGVAAHETENARRLAVNLPRAERLAIEARYHKARNEWNKASEIYRSLWTFFPDDLELGLKLADSLAVAGRGREAREALAALRKLPPPASGDPRIDVAEAEVAMRLADYPTLERAAARAAAKGRELGESQVVAQALVLQGTARLLTGRPRPSFPFFEEAQELYEQAGNRPARQRILTFLGVALREQGEIEQAQRMFETALESARETGSVTGAAVQQGNLGQLAQVRGDLKRALALLEEAYAAFEKVGDRTRAVRVLHAIGAVRLEQGEIAAAQRRFESVLSLSRETGNRLDEAFALHQLGVILALEGRLQEARSRQEQALALFATLGDPSRNAVITAALADLTARQGDLAGGQRQFEAALAVKRRIGDKLSLARMLGSLARLVHERGDLEASRDMALEQLRIARQTGARGLEALALQNLARWQMAAGNLTAAQRLLKEASRKIENLGQDGASTAIRLEQARLALARGRAGEAAGFARSAVLWYSARQLAVEEARARGVLAEALVAAQRLADAQEACQPLRVVAERSEDRVLRVAALTAVARVDAAAGDVGGALMGLRRAVEQSDQIGLVASGLEARLALGSFQLERQDRVAGRQVLHETEKEAERRGFEGLARQAVAALQQALAGPAVGA